MKPIILQHGDSSKTIIQKKIGFHRRIRIMSIIEALGSIIRKNKDNTNKNEYKS